MLLFTAIPVAPYAGVVDETLVGGVVSVPVPAGVVAEAIPEGVPITELLTAATLY